jgi:hypothetical protein
VYSAWARNVKPNHHKFVEPTKRYAHMIIPHHGLWADPGHLLAVGKDPSSLLHEYMNRVSLDEKVSCPFHKRSRARSSFSAQASCRGTGICGGEGIDRRHAGIGKVKGGRGNSDAVLNGGRDRGLQP